MSNMEDMETEGSRHSGSLVKAANRGVKGAFSGIQTGGIIAAGLAATFLAVDAALGTSLSEHVFGHGSAALTNAATFTGIHCLGAAAFEGTCEAYDGYKGIDTERDHIKDAAHGVDEELMKLEGIVQTPGKSTAYQFDNPQPTTSPVIKALVEQGATPQQAELFRDRLAAQQLAQLSQDRSV